MSFYNHYTRIFLILIGLGFSACTQVKVYDADGNTKVKYGFGIVKIILDPVEAPQILSVQGLGLTNSPQGTALGYHSMDLAALPENDCRLVIWVDKNTDFERWADLLSNMEDACLVAEE